MYKQKILRDSIMKKLKRILMFENIETNI